MTKLHPLRFQPLFREYLWGGRRLGSVLHKPIGDGETYAESWEIVDHGEDQSVVAFGPLAGRTLGKIVANHAAELFGQHDPRPQFPLLFKFLDAHRDLSVQVHPCDADAAKLDPPDLGKTEAWVILHADPGALVYAGLNAGVDRDQFAAAIARGETDSCLHRFTPRAGDCIFIPAGTVHALGAGLLVAEIQQASDTTYRLFDWNRVGVDGQPRQLHVQQGLDATDFSTGPVSAVTPRPIASSAGDQHTVERLVACDKFILDRHRRVGDFQLETENRFRIVAVLEGELTIAGDPSGIPLTQGQTILLPAATDRYELAAASAKTTTFLEMSLPPTN